VSVCIIENHENDHCSCLMFDFPMTSGVLTFEHYYYLPFIILLQKAFNANNLPLDSRAVLE
jgi:hypothetical protein